MRWKLWVWGILLGIGLAGCGQSPIANGRIVFSRDTREGETRVGDQSAKNVVETILPIGTGRSQVDRPMPERPYQGGAEMMLPLWSPDGKRMSLISNRNLFILDADGRNAVSIGAFWESSPEEKDFAWSADGKLLAFVDNGSLRVVSADGKRGLLVAENSTGTVYNVPLGWSADGTELFFFEHGVQGKFRLYGIKLELEDFGDWDKVMRQDGKYPALSSLGIPKERRRLLTSWSVGQYQGCRMNVAGQQLACLLSTSQVKLVSTQKGEVSDFLPTKVTGLPKWSPNGEMVAFETYQGLWTIKTHGWGNPVKVTDPVADFAWAPDGKWLAVVPKDGKSGIFRVKPDGKDLTLIVNPKGTVRSISWQGIKRKT